MLLRSVARLLPFALFLGGCAQDEAPADTLPTAPDGGLVVPDAALLLPDGGQGDASAEAAAEPLSGLLTLAEFRGTVDTVAGTMRLEVLDGDAVTDAGLRRVQQGLCTLSIVQDGVAGSGPANSLELVTGTTGLDAACEGYLASPLFCGAVTVRSFYATAQTQVFAQIQSLVPSTGFGVQNGDVVPGASSGLGSWAYGDLGASAAAPANAGVRNWVFARSGGNFTFTGRVVANVTELCDGLDNDCDGATDEGIGCRNQGQSCAATDDCSGALVCTGSFCSPAGCPSGEHVESGACVSDTRSCSIANGTGSQSFASGSWAACGIVSCNSSYHEESGACASDVRSCSAANATAATESWTGADYGPCTASACLPTHHVDAGVCQSNAESCPVTNGIGSRTYNAGAWSSCSLTGCDAGFHVLSGACTSSTRSCTLADGTGSQSWLGSEWGVCTPTACDAGYHVESGACAGDGRSCLLTGGAGDQSWNGSSWNGCVASACYSGFTLSNGSCAAAGCGNGLVEAGEGCDDGNLEPTDGCTATCTVATCGDGLVQAGVEGCDDGNTVTEECNYGAGSCTVCNATCASAAGETDLCGDAVLDAAEVCDDGNTVDDDSCANSCICGAFYHVESGVCTSNARSCVATNAIIAFESWTGSAYGACTATACEATYHLEAGACASATRACSVANATTATQSWTGSAYTVCAATGCAAGYSLLAGACVAAGCGNGAVEAGEACDDGNSVATDGCTSTCTVATCGDGVVQAGVDGCDDGNTVTEECGYGAASCAVCSATCTSVAGETDICGDGILDGAEVCDDGNSVNGDSCTNGCACGTGFHLEGGVCTSDTRSCLLANGIGTEQWNGSSYGSTCSVASCNSGYHVAANSCAADVVSCSLSNATAATQTWNSGTSSYGSCTATACSASYHVESGACAANVRVCTLANGTATESWNSVTSSFGSCTPEACNTGYHVEAGACLSNIRSCSLSNATAATESWTGSAYGACTASACASGYWANAGVCALQPTLGAACTLNAECASGFCATGPTGTANDRCAPIGMNYIPAGTFTMGSVSTEVGGELDETEHSVTLSRSFFMAQTEVTQGQWKALSGGTTNPSCFQSTSGTACTTSNANDSGPAEQMDWFSAVAFANARSASEGLTSCYTLTGCADATNGWKDGIHSSCTGASLSGLSCTGYRLPTESEWEYAARAGTTTATYGGNLSATSGCVTLSGTGGFAAGTALGILAWYNCNAASRAQAVGGKTANSFGLSDMLGNVWEWTGDWYGTYPATVTDPTGTATGSSRVFRGGSWSINAHNVRAANRNVLTPVNRSNSLGFRLSRTVTRDCTTLPANATAGVEVANAGGWACEATACSASYHVEGGLCLTNTRTCSPMPANTTAGTQTWNSGTSTYGSCTAASCASGYWVNAGACTLLSTLGTACTLDAACASGFCATGPDGTANDRCAPTGMNYLPAGTFTMGSPSTEVGRYTPETQHSVTISRSFFMGQTEVTQGQWKALSSGTNPSYFQSTTGTASSTANDNDSGPAEKLDWYAAVGFANARSAAEGLTSCYTLTGCSDAANGWKDGLHSGCTGATLSGLTCTGYRLPTESEWEYAARGGTTTATYGGNLSAATGCVTLSGTGGFAAGTAFSSLAWYDCNDGSRTQAVGGKSANSFGLSDMLGNVWEWTGDWLGTYPGTVTDPTGPSTGSSRVYRGGSWGYGAGLARAAFRYGGTPGLRALDLGFRLSRTATRGCAALPANATAALEAATASGWGACEATACSASYHLEGGACLSDTRSCSPMPAGTTAGTQTWTGSAYGTCTVTSCSASYHLESGVCMSNTRTCSPMPANATAGTQIWTGSAYGSCTASACVSGYIVVGGVCLANLGTACTLNAECAFGFCATGPTGTANDRCAPTDMNYIPAATFSMGSPSTEVGRYPDETQHSVTISRSFFMAQTEVTQLQWKALSGGINPSARGSDSGPVEQMDWYASLAFANARSAAEGLTSCYALAGCVDATNGWKDGLHSSCTGATLSGLTCTGYRLPTESEWEYAARAGTSTATYLGNLSAPGTGCSTPQANLDGIAWWCRGNYSTQAVGSKAANSFGLFDMLGNVSEWTGDLYGAYPGTVTDPTGPTTGSSRVHRGGSWNNAAIALRAAGNRRNDNPDYRTPQKGFRLVRTVTRGCAALPANATAGVEAANASGWGACEVVACATGYVVNAGACIPDNLGASCTANAQCAAGNCATGPDGTANDRCAPTGMNYIPAGTFTMGSPSVELGRANNETQHSVTISRRFFLGQTEVTQGQWKTLSGGTNPSYFQSTTGEFSSANDNDNGPVEQLDWYSAVAFANARSAAEGLASCYTLTGCTDAAIGWKDGLHSGCWGATFSGPACTGYRLPTESEWEYAARGGTITATYAGNLSGVVLDCTTAQVNLEGIAWWCRSSGRRTQATGSKLPNTFGLFDMLGNVYEWVGDWYGAYPGTVTDPTGATSGLYRGMRGGSLINEPSAVRSAWREGTTPDSRNRIRGLRLARTVP